MVIKHFKTHGTVMVTVCIFYMKQYLLFFALLMVQGHIMAQVTEVTYKRALRSADISTEIKNKYGDSGIKLLQEQEKALDQLKYTLLFNNTEALFFIDAVTLGLKSEIDNNSYWQLVKREKENKYYYNRPNKQLTYQTLFFGEALNIISSPNELEWKITTESKSIGGFLCYRAVLRKGHNLLGFGEESTIEAWFTPQIPVPYGPKQLEGLPGLIMEAQLATATYYVSKINSKTTAKISPLEKRNEITRTQQVNALLEFKRDVLNRGK
ncbi:GLPGLI family protein [Bizionia saleffrena]|uniref:GLPGLI family protein n=2 Tax=Bizionia saleffrena TaxID=291189 RepID=A0A8H2LBX8_9FLAO|nr:GLPGLI family protein [Bizionia saleffrena]